jgi:hypothetical protein
MACRFEATQLVAVTARSCLVAERRSKARTDADAHVNSFGGKD